MLDFLYTLLIYPIESVLNFIYILSFRIFVDNGIVIIIMSLSVTLLSLPLYNIAEKWQNIERDTQKRLKNKLKDIKAVFKGDEQHMIIQTYYRQNNYHPIYTLRSILGLAIQVPFFFAAYHYLVNLESLSGTSFLFLNDLGKPDGLLQIGSFSINILPFIMTIINIVSTMIYSRKLELKEKIQLFAMALFFLVLLYASPSGLVLYWTMNNLFSLKKNIILKLKNPLLVFRRIVLLTSFLLFLYTISLWFFSYTKTSKKIILNLIFGTIFFFQLLIPFLFRLLKYFKKFFKDFYQNDKVRNALFYTSCLILCILIGVVVPTFLISSSPHEFAESISNMKNPLILLRITFIQAVSIFFVYSIVIYKLFGKNVKFGMTILYIFCVIFSLVNVFFFTGNYGNISTELILESTKKLYPEFIPMLINIFVVLLLSFVILFIIKIKLYKIVTSLFVILFLALIVLSAKNVIQINQSFSQFKRIKSEVNTLVKSSNKIEPVFRLSKTKQNVLIIMLDKAISSYFSESLKYDPTIKDSMNGFVYYPNTVSFYGYTIMGAPPLFGGYEYTPQNINLRDKEPLVKKHNESLLVMPRIFKENGYNAIITDPSFANYCWAPDISIFKEYDITSDILFRKYTDQWLKKHSADFPEYDESFKNQYLKTTGKYFLSFSFFRSLPLFLRPVYYDKGNYWYIINRFTQKNKFLNFDLVDNYSVLEFLPDLFNYDSNNSEFIVLVNETAHEPQMLYGPDFMPGKPKDEHYQNNYKLPFDDIYSLEHFTTNYAVIKKLSVFFDKLKEENVYDNTKIIIVSDHGKNVYCPPFHNFSDSTNDILTYGFFNPLLIVKDFNSKDELSISNEFMTNADTPSIALSHINNPVNPFTGNVIKTMDKKNGFEIVMGHRFMFDEHGKYKFNFSDKDIVFVKDNIFIKENWKGVVK